MSIIYANPLNLGLLTGIAIRSGSPLSINLAEPVWKQMAGMPLTISDLTEIDKDFVPGKGFVCGTILSLPCFSV